MQTTLIADNDGAATLSAKARRTDWGTGSRSQRIVTGLRLMIRAANHRTIFSALLLASACGALAACGGTSARPARVAVPVTDMKSVAGQWAGTFSRDTSSHEDWIRLTIDPDGNYEFSSQRQIGAFAGKGTLLLKEGKLVAEGPRGSSVYTLYQRGNAQLLSVNARTNDGATYSAELSRTR